MYLLLPALLLCPASSFALYICAQACDTPVKGGLQDGESLPSYRGDIINGPEFTPEARVPDPQRLVRAYNQSASTMNLLRAFSTGGYAGLERVVEWNLDFMANTPEGNKYIEVAKRVDESIQFMRVWLELNSNFQMFMFSFFLQN